MRTLKMYNPVGFDPLAVLPKNLHRYADDARYFVHLIFRRAVFHKEYRGRRHPVRLHSSLLRKQLNYDHYRDVINTLIAAGVVESDDQYIKGVQSTGYWLSEAYRHQRIISVEATSKSLCKRIVNNRDGDDLDVPVLRHLHGWLTKTGLDFNGASAWIDAWEKRRKPKNRRSMPRFHARLDQMRFSLSSIREGDWYFKKCLYGRVHTNVTSLKKELRSYLRFAGRPLIEIDIANSQPLFLGLILNGRLQEPSISREADHLLDLGDVCRVFSEVRNHPSSTPTHPIHYVAGNGSGPESFLSLCEEGNLYEFLMNRWRGKDRAKFKKQFFSRVFFSRNSRFYPEQEFFASEFPEVWEAVKEIKRKDYRHLSRTLQRVESRLMIGRVATRLMNEFSEVFFLTIHDSILTTQDHASLVEAVMREEFARCLCNPTLRRTTAEPSTLRHLRA